MKLRGVLKLKIILSRKGFDSAAGGYANPILPDGTLLSLPIPDDSTNTSYEDLRLGGRTYFEIMSDLKGEYLKENGQRRVLSKQTKCHLDPDIRKRVVVRPTGWKGLFGQVGAAQGHLSNMGVETGDLFLFFGWFRRTIEVEGTLKFDPNDKNGKHIIYGYLEIDKIIEADDPRKFEQWMIGHPHTIDSRLSKTGNALYVAKEKLSGASVVSGFGVFDYHESLVLTKEGNNKSKWSLPNCFRGADISYHSSSSWKEGYFKSASRGQEFVIDENDLIVDWVIKLIRSNNCVELEG